MSKKVLVIGLDSADPHLTFDLWLDQLPNLKKMATAGSYGRLRSTDPPITIPAWTSMMTGKDPGTLGFYGFRNRRDYSYDQMFFATSAVVKEPTVWDTLSAAGKRVVMLGVPQTYPPKPVNGSMIGCFLTPGPESDYTYPKELKEEIDETVPGYMLDVSDFRTDDKDRLLGRIYEMTEKRFTLARHLITAKPWDFFMMVEMGIDRIQHGFWKYFDASHAKHEPGGRYAGAVPDYYRFVDEQVGRLVEAAGDCTVLIVSDHGAQRMDGGICINEWLIRHGYLTLKRYPEAPEKLSLDNVDWTRTKAWGEGGYYGRLCINVRGREPEGVVEPAAYEPVRDALIAQLEAITDEDGRLIGTRAHRPQDIYRQCRGVPPDLLVYFGDLAWRSVGSVGHGRWHVYDNDTGPDDANHARDGIYIMSAKGAPDAACGLDIAPTILGLFDIAVPADVQGRDLLALPVAPIA